MMPANLRAMIYLFVGCELKGTKTRTSRQKYHRCSFLWAEPFQTAGDMPSLIQHLTICMKLAYGEEVSRPFFFFSFYIIVLYAKRVFYVG